MFYMLRVGWPFVELAGLVMVLNFDFAHMLA